MALLETQHGATHAYDLAGIVVFSPRDIAKELGLPPEPPPEHRLEGLSPQDLKVAIDAGDIALKAA